jgi:hypothetical protein
MSLAFLLAGWIAASVVLSPIIGRFLAGTDKSQIQPRQTVGKSRVSPRDRPRHAEAMRRNVAIQHSRREAGWPRAG